MSKKSALITGITGQDGSYLAELLLNKGYEVHGMVRRVALEAPEYRLQRLKPILDRITLHAGSLESHATIFSLIDKLKPTECFHLAAQSFVSYSFEDAFSTFDTNINGTLYLLSAIKDRSPTTRFYFAATSEMFGNAGESPQRETTPFHPRSPYGISKVTGFDVVRNFRESYGMFACSGILFNHESPRRGFEFVTRKITSTVARIKAGRETKLPLGNLEPRRDWGFAGDYVRAMVLMLHQDKPDDYVVATGETHSVREFAELAFQRAGLDWRDHVVIDEKFYRPAEVFVLQGDSSKARRELGWAPTVGFAELVAMMVDADLARVDAGPHSS
ncbi:MAG TPA: GDP-mannose 4,6-dehydratase [Polyangiaceae bacterium]|jgi:GDPmannose 4,6-dehydratase|nr:GDP-mannose 4,6-dehydratase [Polyangiaceae bacterium]